MKRLFWVIPLLSLFIACNSKKQKETESTETKTTMIDTVINETNELYLLVGTYTSGKSNGIYLYRFDTINGNSKYVSMVDIDNPSYLVLDKTENFVYSVTENEDETSRANAISFDKENGKLIFLNSQPTGGGAPCYINIDSERKHLVTADYLGGDVSVFPIKEDGTLDLISQVVKFTGKGPDADRQEQAHIHCVQFSPDEKYLFADDLGTDKIHKFEVNKSGTGDFLKKGKPDAFLVAGGEGPRHLTFHPNGKYAYLITEMGGNVIAFNYKDGNLKEFQSIKADTLNAKGSGDIQITPDGRFLYASNRLDGDGIAIFSVDQSNGKLSRIGYQSTGIHPRNFVITPNGKLLLVACRDSNVIHVFAINQETGLLKALSKDIELDMPVCLKFASMENKLNK